MPPKLAERCILASTRPGDVVLDPFSGAGTQEQLADEQRRRDEILEELRHNRAKRLLDGQGIA